MFFRLRLGLTLLTVTIVLSLYTLTSVAVYTIVQRVVVDSIDKRLTGVVHRFLQQRGMPTVPPLGDYVWIDSGTVTYSNLSPYMVQEFKTLIQRNGPSTPFSVSLHEKESGTELRVLYFPNLLSNVPHAADNFALIAGDFSRELTVLNGLRITLFLVGAAGGVVATLAGFFLAGRSLSPIRRSWQRQLDFVADASHEMRTPLSVIQANLGLVMEHSQQSVGENLEWINNAHSEARRLSKLVQDLLTLARADQETNPIERAPVCISDVVEQVIDLFEPVMVSRDVHLIPNIMEGLMITGDRDRLHQLLVILLDNASKFTPEDGTVSVTVDVLSHNARIEVKDTGSGIPSNELARVFDRFYRADKARQHGGAGLGLAIAKWIVSAHLGKIQISSEVGVGTVVTVLFPLS